MFVNPFVNILGQQMILLRVVWLSVEIEYFFLKSRKCRVNEGNVL